MKDTILKLLSRNARMSLPDLATATGLSEDEVERCIREMEKEGLIRGYKAVIDWDKLGGPGSVYVSAMIELKVTPKPGCGFEEVAERIARYPEVESVYLMSGTYDLSVIVKGHTFQEVAMFVAKELSTIESVTATATHFVLRRYKELDVQLGNKEPDERGTISLC